MPSQVRPRFRRRFALSLWAAVVGLLLLTVTAIGSFALWSVRDIDAASLHRQTQLIAHVITSQLHEVPHAQESAAVWDAAVVAARENDQSWMEMNIGEWMFNYVGHDRSFVLRPDNRIIFASSQGMPTSTDRFDGLAETVLPMVAEVRAKLASGDAFDPGGDSADVPRVADVVIVDGAPAIASIMPIVTDSGDLRQAPGTESLLISVVMLDEDFTQRLLHQYLLETGQFSVKQRNPGTAAFPVTNRNGRFITFFEWQPYRPGHALLNRTAPALAIGLLVAGALVFILLDQLWRASTAIENGRRAAEHQASHDDLTGLANRSSFDRQLGRILATKRTRDSRPTLLMLDLDRFKQVNDTLGHQAGDDLIRAVGQRLHEIIAPGDILARLGGDEFAILHVNRGNQAEVVALCQRIIQAIGKPFEIFGSEAFVGVSIGAAIAAPEDVDRNELTRKADIALYEAKSNGRNRTIVFEEEMNEVLQNRHAIEADLREALRATDQLWVAFQPLFGRDSGNVVGAEALVRWTHPRLGQISPVHFVAVAEGTGQIEALGEFVLRRALTLGAKWPGRSIAVNISPTQLRNPRFPDRVFEMLRHTGMRPEGLEFEITESILLDDEHSAMEAITRFRSAGIRIALDDFGTGYSSLNYLKRYPVDRIKIDRSFVSQLTDAGTSTAIVQAMVTLAHALKIKVTAEGVESGEQFDALAGMGCDTFQGFLLSAPVEPGAIEAMFENGPLLARVA